MLRISRAAMLATVTLATTLAGSTPAIADPAPLTPETTVGEGFGTIVTDGAGNALAVSGTSAVDSGQVQFRYRRTGGQWSANRVVPGLGGKLWAAASGQVRVPLVVGTIENSERNAGVLATNRRRDASWSSPARLDAGLGGYSWGVDAAGNTDGDFAVSWTMGSGAHEGSTYVSIRQRGGSWHRSLVGVRSDVSLAGGPQPRTSVGIDSHGNVVVARTVTSAGGSTHRLLIRRKPVDGAWQAPRQMSGAGQSVRWQDLVVEPTGRQTIAYQLVDADSPDYGDSFVRRQATLGAGLSLVWRRQATSRPSIAAAGNRLRVVWSTVSGTDPAQGHTQAFNPAVRPVQELTGDPAEYAGVAMNSSGEGVVVTGANNDQVFRPFTATSLGAGQPAQTGDDGSVAVHPALGAGSEYFVGADTRLLLPGGEDSVLHLDVFRSSRS